jgi:hypothetical protein
VASKYRIRKKQERAQQRRKESECGDKVRYNSKTEAVARLINMQKMGKFGLHSYQCSFCCKWHLGH